MKPSEVKTAEPEFGELLDFITNIVKKLVSKPSDVTVLCVRTTKNIIFNIYANKKDHGKVIGKKGKTIESIKHLVTVVKNMVLDNDPRSVSIEIVEEEPFIKK